MTAFQKLLIPSIPPVLHFPVTVNTSLIQTLLSGSTTVQHTRDDSLAIVPVKPPSRHSVLLHLWAFWHSDNQAHLSSSTTDVEVEVPAKRCLEPFLDAVYQDGASASQGTRKALSLPKTVSKRNSKKPLVTQGCRRSSRLNISEGFKHSQLPDMTPRKKRKVLDSATLRLLDNPPRPSEVVPAPVPIETLQQWGLFCNVSPSELTADELMTRKTMMDRMLRLNLLLSKFYFVSLWLLCLAWIIFLLVDLSSFSYYVLTLWCLWTFQTLLCFLVGPMLFYWCASVVWFWVFSWHLLVIISWLCLGYALVALIPHFNTSVTNE
jgi:hypothetical protein